MLGGPRGRVLRSQARRAFVWIAVLALLAGAAAAIWLGTPYHGQEEGIAAVDADTDVALNRTDGGGYVMRPTGNPTDVGLVLYPGARVHPDAYIASLAPLVEQGHVTVVVPNMPLNMALLDHRAGHTALAGHPEVDRWYVGGHSLGGVAACRYARNAGDRLAGVVLLASYCDVDLRDADLRILSVTGEADTVLDREAYRAATERLPADRTAVSLSGVNHTQFADYRGQAGDEPSGTAYDVAHERLANDTLAWLGVE
ncbi:MAG: alpha/beta hydrolase [Haloarculaceae archaeon]